MKRIRIQRASENLTGSKCFPSSLETPTLLERRRWVVLSPQLARRDNSGVSGGRSR